MIWTNSASQDYLNTEVDRANQFAAAVDAALRLLRIFPEMGSQVRHSKNLRRILVGRKRQYGIYYGFTASRIIVVALLDLRRDPATLEAIIRERSP